MLVLYDHKGIPRQISGQYERISTAQWLRVLESKCVGSKPSSTTSNWAIWVIYVILNPQTTCLYRRNNDGYLVGVLVPPNKLLSTKPSTFNKYSIDNSYGHIIVSYNNHRTLHSLNIEDLISGFGPLYTVEEQFQIEGGNRRQHIILPSLKGPLQTVTSPFIPFTKMVSGNQFNDVSHTGLSDTCSKLEGNWLYTMTAFIALYWSQLL